ncbi:hypothetical protein GCM10010492_64940 [Saccharothrix mutabilis subsp. mutabilis]|uniref:Uncharacterized protein n=1 Tax=Saccharothrix mutabilis subsp. mutabilis TaxID=66855 RepID=A0ABP3EA79_9PSEU
MIGTRSAAHRRGRIDPNTLDTRSGRKSGDRRAAGPALARSNAASMSMPPVTCSIPCAVTAGANGAVVTNATSWPTSRAAMASGMSGKVCP